MSVLVIGGGISGLSAAYYLSKKIPSSAVYLWEASERIGGWIKSERNNNGVMFEQSARTLRPKSKAGVNTLSLIEELHLSDKIRPILSSSPAAKNRLIYVHGKLHCLPSSLSSLFKTIPPFSKPLITNILKEFTVPPKKANDEPIYDFMKRRFGSEFAEYLMNPLICGICAGNAKEISVHFLASQLFEYEQTYGSITKGVILNMFNKERTLQKSFLLDRVKKENWNVYSFNDGLEALPKKLLEVITTKGVKTHLNTTCDKIEFNKNEVIVYNRGNSVKVKHVISSLLSENLALLVRHQHPKLSNLLQKIQSVNVAIVNLQFKGNLIKDPAFGFLVPPQENVPILGVIFDSCCFKQGDNTILTVMMGGYWFNKYFSNIGADKFYEIALNNVKCILKIPDDPISYKVTILKKCIPQYNVGHMETVKEIRNYIESRQLPLSLCGMSFDGVGVNDVILSANKSVEDIVKI